MKHSKIFLAALLAAAAAGPVLAQGTAGGAGGSTGTGATSSAATGGASAGTTGVTTGSTAGATTTANRMAPADGSNARASQQASGMGSPGMMPGYTQIPGSVVAQASSNTSVNGNTTVTTNRYWVNVPAGVERSGSFQRWQHLK